MEVSGEEHGDGVICQDSYRKLFLFDLLSLPIQSYTRRNSVKIAGGKFQWSCNCLGYFSVQRFSAEDILHERISRERKFPLRHCLVIISGKISHRGSISDMI